MKLVWFPTWRCQNYDSNKSHSHRCPYCPYGFSGEERKLLYEGRPASPGGSGHWEKVALFLINNRPLLKNFVEISGGEPLLYENLPDVLRETRFKWAITSNTIRGRMVRDLGEAGALDRCTSWSASYHPCSERDEEFAEVIDMLYTYGVRPQSTVVVSRHTIPRLGRALKFLNSLPLRGINWHIDAHSELSQQERDKAESIIGKVRYATDNVPTGVTCRKHGELLALGPDGTLYPCVTYCYQGIKPIGPVMSHLNLDALPDLIEWCDDECFACCDWIKHVKEDVNGG